MSRTKRSRQDERVAVLDPAAAEQYIRDNAVPLVRDLESTIARQRKTLHKLNKRAADHRKELRRAVAAETERIQAIVLLHQTFGPSEAKPCLDEIARAIADPSYGRLEQPVPEGPASPIASPESTA